MKPRSQINRPQHWHSRGITLIECLVYIGALAIVFGMGLTAFYRCIETNAATRRNSDDIIRVLTVGEIWRADIRATTQTPRFNSADQTLHLAQASNEVVYKFSEDQIQRRTTPDSEWKIILSGVQQSEMIREPRTHITAWRWELELKPRREPALIRPLFTFTAAPAQP